MKTLNLDLERFRLGFKVGEILDPYMSDFKEKYINNDYLSFYDNDCSEFENNIEFEKAQFMMTGLAVFTKDRETKENPLYRIDIKKLFVDSFKNFKAGKSVDNDMLYTLYFLFYDENKELFDKNEQINKLKLQIDMNFIMFLIVVLNSLSIKSNISPISVGIMNRISDSYKKEKLTFRQKYVIISQLIFLYLKKLNINNKEVIEIFLHAVIWLCIDKTDKEFDYLQEIGAQGYISFLNSKMFRSPMSTKALEKMFFNIEQMYKERESLERVAAIDIYRQIIEEKERPVRTKRKEWNKNDFIVQLKKYKSQSEMANACGVSRQRISELKKKFKIKEL
jgi:hypothetical protein